MIVVKLPDCTVDLSTRTATRNDTSTARLTEQESALLLYLVKRAGETVPREDLLEQVLGYAPNVRSRAVDHALARLRGKIEIATPTVLPVHGVGYRLVIRAPSTRGPDPFVGRSAERARLGTLLDGSSQDGARLVTVHGPGGIGKSRLIREVVHEKALFPGGILRGSLEHVREACDLAQILAQALELPEIYRDPVGRVGRVLGLRGRTLLCLDDAEMAIPALRETLPRWLEQAEDLVVLVASRTRLDLAGEVLLSLGPLSADESATLVCTRMEAAGRAVDPVALAALVLELDGIPLALELAAARARTAGIVLVTERIDELLTSPPLRRAVLETTHLLPRALQRCWARLGIFRAPFPVEAALRVIAPEAKEISPFDPLSELVDRGLVQVQPDGWLKMLAPLRAIAREALGEDEEARRAHASWYTRWGDRQERAAFTGPEGDERKRTLLRELQDLWFATEQALAAGDLPTAVRGLRGLTAIAPEVGGVDRLAGMIELALRSAVAPERGQLLSLAAVCSKHRGELARAETLLQESIALLHAASDAHGELVARFELATVWSWTGRTTLSHEAFDAIQKAASARGESFLAAAARGSLGNTLHALGRTHEAQQETSVAIAQLEHLGARQLQAIFLGNLAVMCRHLGQNARAKTLYEQAIACFLEVGNVSSECVARVNRAMVERIDNPDRAAAEVQHAWERSRAVCLHWLDAFVLTGRAQIRMEQGEGLLALADFDLALTEHMASGNLGDLATTRAFRARLLGALAHPSAASAFDEAILGLEQTQQSSTLAVTLARRAQWRRRSGHLDAARGDLQRAMALVDTGQSPLIVAELWASQACLEAAMGDTAAATCALDRAQRVYQGYSPDPDVDGALQEAYVLRGECSQVVAGTPMTEGNA